MADTPPTQAAELAAALHDLADRIASFDGALPRSVTLRLLFLTFDDKDIPRVDLLGQALLGIPGETEKVSDHTWHHSARTKIDPLDVKVYTTFDPPANEDPAALRARITELELRLAQERGEA